MTDEERAEALMSTLDGDCDYPLEAIREALRAARLEELDAAIRAVCSWCDEGRELVERPMNGGHYHPFPGDFKSHCWAGPLHTRRASLSLSSEEK